MTEHKLSIQNLQAQVVASDNSNQKPDNALNANILNANILNGVNLEIKSNQLHFIMGPNGSGKSTLGYTLMGSPKYQITGGEIFLDKTELNNLTPDLRARAGLFLASQYPVEVPGISVSNFLRTAYNDLHQDENKEQTLGIKDFLNKVKELMNNLNMDEKFNQRNLNLGFSGGEKKKLEILQLQLFQPKFAILDEIDSGLDVDALKLVAQGIQKAQNETQMGILVITHHANIMKYLTPQFVHIFAHGKIIKSGGPELALEVEAKGYKDFINNNDS